MKKTLTIDWMDVLGQSARDLREYFPAQLEAHGWRGQPLTRTCDPLTWDQIFEWEDNENENESNMDDNADHASPI